MMVTVLRAGGGVAAGRAGNQARDGKFINKHNFTNFSLELSYKFKIDRFA